jgi:outer membrane protein TolC
MSSNQRSFSSKERAHRRVCSAGDGLAVLVLTLGATFLGCQTGNPIHRQQIHQQPIPTKQISLKPTPVIQLAAFQSAPSTTPTEGLISAAVGDTDLPPALTVPQDRTDIGPEESAEDALREDVGPENAGREEPSEAQTESSSEAAQLPYEDLDQPLPSNTSALDLSTVLTSVTQCYPEIDMAIGELETANGKVLASWGEFDQVFTAHSISQPLGFYQTYRNGVGLARPLFNGGEVYGTYRIGDGNFEPWYGERETNEAGEFKAGFSIPLLKDRAIDERRAKLFASGFQRDQVESNIESRLLRFQRFATQAYWDWVASGQVVQIQQQILELANQRVDQIEQRIETGDLALIAQIDNDRFIAKRKNDLIKARRSLEKAAIKLSLFWRDGNCAPIIADAARLPVDFPSSVNIAADQLAADIKTALCVRPEIQELNAARQEAYIDLQYAQNLTLPKVDLKGFAGQDIGGETSSLGDKTPFELQIGVLAEVPLQRRKGLGKIQAAEGKLTQIDAKTRFASDKIRAEVQDAASAVNAAYDQIKQSKENVRLTRKSLELGRLAFKEGDIDLIALNIYESAVADAQLQLLDAQFKYFFYQTVYQTAISARFE